MFKPVTEIRSIFGKPKEVVLIDNGYLSHRSYNAQPGLSVQMEGRIVFTGDIFSYMQTVTLLARGLPAAAIIICMDVGECFRKKEFPEYKAQRKPRREAYAKNAEVFLSLSLLPNVYFAAAPGYEADDVIFTLSFRFQPHFKKVYIFSSDQDLYQCLCHDNVLMTSSIKNGKPVEFSGEDAKAKMKVAPECVPFLKAIRGDKSDNIPSALPKIPSALIEWIMTLYDAPEAFLESDPNSHEYPKKSWKTWYKKLQAASEPLMRNYGLVKLRETPNLSIVQSDGSWQYIEQYKMQSVKIKINAILEAVR